MKATQVLSDLIWLASDGPGGWSRVLISPQTLIEMRDALAELEEHESPLLIAPNIATDSWLHWEKYTDLRHAVQYAGQKSLAIPVLAKISPEEAGVLFTIMQRGYLRSELRSKT